MNTTTIRERARLSSATAGLGCTATAAVHAGRGDLAELGVHAPPLDLSTTYPVADVAAARDSYDTMAAGGRPGPGGHVYARLWNPTVARFEEALASLEGTPDAVAFGSGMAAMTAVLLATASRGRSHVVAVRPLYGGTDHLLGSGLLGTTVSWVDADSVERAITPSTGLVVCETPANPTLDLVDIAAVVAAAGEVPVLVDNTFATPVLQRPALHGAALVLHSATKYLGGHGDVVGGVVACGQEWAERLRATRAVTGALLHPLAGYLLLRGLPTLPVRVRAQQETATRLAASLEGHPQVAAVLHPSLAGADPLGLLGRQLAGPGSMLSLLVRGGPAAARRTAESCRLVTHAVSLGGVDTLVQHPASLTHRPVPADVRPPESLLRLSVGLEDLADLQADLDQALQAGGRRGG